MQKLGIFHAPSQELENERIARLSAISKNGVAAALSGPGVLRAPVATRRHSKLRAKDFSRLDWAIYWFALGTLFGAFWIVATRFL